MTMHEHADLLLEIGVEELPARFIPTAMEQLQQIVTDLLTESRIGFGPVKTFGTPRRLALLVTGVSERQQGIEQEMKGPPVRAAFTPDGEPTPAATGFAAAQGVDLSALVRRTTPTGEYVFAVKKESGRPTKDGLPDLLARLVIALEFPKSMRWGSGDFRFARPVRWLVALFGDEVVPFEVEGLRSGRTTRGHRFASSGEIEIHSAPEYEQRLLDAHVVADPQVRRRRIWEFVQSAATQAGGRVVEDPELLDEVTYLVEDTAAVYGGFNSDYLQLPDQVLITPMKEHQRYFPVVDEKGKLLAKFVTVTNGAYGNADLIRTGNEKVLSARLADAQFFFVEDAKRPLHQRVQELGNIVYQERLGTILEKVERIVALTRSLGTLGKISDEAIARSERAALLSKADLVTHMVYEFPELQGLMGCEYALLSGEDPRVAQAILEHTMPRGAGDQLPQSVEGALVAVADKIDTLVGCFAAGLIPSGSQDPYGLRRQAIGIIRILLDGTVELDLSSVIGAALAGYGGRFADRADEVGTRLADFFRLRLRGLLMDRGLRSDWVDAAIAAGVENVPAVLRRALALQGAWGSEPLQGLLTLHQRAANLAAKAAPSPVRADLLREAAETALHAELLACEKEVASLWERGAYQQAIQRLAALKPTVDRFFEEILVMAPEADVRQNRLALLQQIVQLAAPLGDLRKIDV